MNSLNSLGRTRTRIRDLSMPQHQAMLIGLAGDLAGVGSAISRVHIALRNRSIFPEEGIRLWNDCRREANRLEIKQHLQLLAQSTHRHPLQNMLLLFVGHGEYRADQYHILLPDRAKPQEYAIKPDNADPDDWLAWEELLSWLKPIAVQNLLLILDSCHAGRLMNADMQSWFEAHATEGGGHTRVLIAGNSGDELTWEQNGICFFTESLAEGLECWGEYNEHGVIDTDVLFDYLLHKVQIRAREAGVVQRPSRLDYTREDAPAMALTQPMQCVRLDTALLDALREQRCLLWVGGSLQQRAEKSFFPDEWLSQGNIKWRATRDARCQPGETCYAISALHISVLDTGFDTLIARCMRGRHKSLCEWIPSSAQPVIEADRHALVLIRPSGDPASADFKYMGSALSKRFHIFIDWLKSGQAAWDTMLILGLPRQDGLTDQWLEEIAQVFCGRIWLVLPDAQSDELINHYSKLGVKLIFAQDKAVIFSLSSAIPHYNEAIQCSCANHKHIAHPTTAINQLNPSPQSMPLPQSEPLPQSMQLPNSSTLSSLSSSPVSLLVGIGDSNQQGALVHNELERSCIPQPPRASYHPEWYIHRVVEERDALGHLKHSGAPIVLWGPELFGKTWMLKYLLEVASSQEQREIQVVEISMGQFDEESLNSLEALLQELANQIVDELDLSETWVLEAWRRPGNPMRKLTWLMEKRVLPEIQGLLLLAFDRIDLVKDRDYVNDFFGLLRSWAEDACRESWSRLRLLLAVSTTPSLLTKSSHQSPFNLTPPIKLGDFNREQIQELASRYQLSTKDHDLDELMTQVGGHPFLNRLIMYHAALNCLSIHQVLLEHSHIFNSYLNRYRTFLQRFPRLESCLRDIVRDPSVHIDAECYHLLYNSGLIVADQQSGYRLRYNLYNQLL